MTGSRFIALAALVVCAVPAAAQTPEITGVTPDSLAISAGGAPATVRITVRGADRLSGVRFTLGRAPVTTLEAAPRLVAARPARTGTSYVFELGISASAAAAAGRYSMHLVTSAGRGVSVPLELHVSRPAARTAAAGDIRAAPGATASASGSIPVPGARADGARPAETLARLALTVGCRGTAVAMHAGAVASLGERTLPGRGPYALTICASDGFGSYRWEVVAVTPGPGTPAGTRVGAGCDAGSSRECTLRITRPARSLKVRLRVQAMDGPGGPVAQQGDAELLLSLPEWVPAGAPTITRYWVTAPRPGTSGRLVNDGIFDAALTEDTRDGEVWIEGRNLSGPGLEVGMSTGAEATLLDLRTTGDVQVLRARLRDFRGGYLSVSHLGGTARTSTMVPRLGYWGFPTAEFSALMGGLSCSIGRPVRSYEVRMPDGTRRSGAVRRLEGSGFVGDLLDMRSRRITLRTERGTPGESVVVVLTVEFESDGAEFAGEFTPGTMWECGSFRVETSRCSRLDLACFGDVIGSALSSSLACLDAGNWRQRPMPAIAVSGDVDAPAAEFRATLERGIGGLVLADVTGRFRGNIALRTGAGSVPLGPLQELVTTEADSGLTRMARNGGLGEQLAELVNQHARNAGVDLIRYVDRFPDGVIYLEYDKRN